MTSSYDENDPHKRCPKCNIDYGMPGDHYEYCCRCGTKLEIYIPEWMKKEEPTKDKIYKYRCTKCKKEFLAMHFRDYRLATGSLLTCSCGEVATFLGEVTQ